VRYLPLADSSAIVWLVEFVSFIFCIRLKATACICLSHLATLCGFIELVIRNQIL
jgi:hypothetical protein